MDEEERTDREARSDVRHRDWRGQDGALVWIPKRNVSQFGRGWFQMAQDTLKRLNAERKALGLEGLVVFNALMARLDFENYIQVSQADIAAEVDMKPSNVSRQ